MIDSTDPPAHLPVAIRDILIEGFRGIEQLHLSFIGANGEPARIAVLAGPNGCGKTSVLEACLLAVGRPELVLGTVNSRAIRAGANDFRVKATLQTPAGRRCVEYGSRTAPEWQLALCDYFTSWRAPKLVGAVGITAGTRGERRTTGSDRLPAIKQYLVNAKAYQSMSSSSSSASAIYEDAMAGVNRVWSMFYPGRGQAFSVEPAGAGPREGFDVFLNMPDGGRVQLDLLSSGQLEVFIFAGSMLEQWAEGGLMLVDEPELHLDPQWHRVILRAMMTLRPKCQFIVGTHSPEVYDSVMSYERHFLVPEDDPRAKAWDGATATEQRA